MSRYVTHQFAHRETLKRAERWLLQCGFTRDQIESHRDGVPRIAVLASPEQTDKAAMIFHAAELQDPDGWPSFWETSRMHHPHVEPDAEPTDTKVVTTRPTPVGWHPPDKGGAADGASELTEVWDVSTRFS